MKMRQTSPRLSFIMITSALHTIFDPKSKIICNDFSFGPVFKSKSVKEMTRDEIQVGIASDKMNQKITVKGAVTPPRAKAVKFRATVLIQNIRGKWEPENLTLRFGKVRSFFRFERNGRFFYRPIKEKP